MARDSEGARRETDAWRSLARADSRRSHGDERS